MNKWELWSGKKIQAQLDLSAMYVTMPGPSTSSAFAIILFEIKCPEKIAVEEHVDSEVVGRHIDEGFWYPNDLFLLHTSVIGSKHVVSTNVEGAAVALFCR